MANIIKQTAYKWIEKKMGNEAAVLNVRAWNPPTMYQIDLASSQRGYVEVENHTKGKV